MSDASEHRDGSLTTVDAEQPVAYLPWLWIMLIIKLVRERLFRTVRS